MQTASLRIWTKVTNSISYNDDIIHHLLLNDNKINLKQMHHSLHWLLIKLSLVIDFCVNNQLLLNLKLSICRKFNSSNLLCDCQLAWFPKWLSHKDFRSSVTAVCAHPQSSKGKSIFAVRPEDFACSKYIPFYSCTLLKEHLTALKKHYRNCIVRIQNCVYL